MARVFLFASNRALQLHVQLFLSLAFSLSPTLIFFPAFSLPPPIDLSRIRVKCFLRVDRSARKSSDTNGVFIYVMVVVVTIVLVMLVVMLVVVVVVVVVASSTLLLLLGSSPHTKISQRKATQILSSSPVKTLGPRKLQRSTRSSDRLNSHSVARYRSSATRGAPGLFTLNVERNST
jgi:hypothetical protein